MKYLYLNIIAKGNKEKINKFYEKFGSDDYKNAKGIMRQTFIKVVNESTVEYFKDIKSDTLLIWGEVDKATPLYMAKVFEKNIKNSGLVVLKNSGHYSYIDDYNVFNAVLNSYLKETRQK